jgi:hypothetical protein
MGKTCNARRGALEGPVGKGHHEAALPTVRKGLSQFKIGMMPPIEEYLERADKLAQDVVNDWGMNVNAGNVARFTEEYKALCDKALSYRDTKEIADNHRQFKSLSEEDTTRETTTRQAFAEAFKNYREKPHTPR